MLLRFKQTRVNMQDNNNDTPAHLAAIKNHMETLSILENHATYVHGLQNHHGQSPYEMSDTLRALKKNLQQGLRQALRK